MSKTTTITEEYDKDGNLVKKTTEVFEDDAHDLEPVKTKPWRMPNPPWERPMVTWNDEDKKAQEWFAACPCNPANGGSGICNCVNPFNQIICSTNACQTDGYGVK